MKHHHSSCFALAMGFFCVTLFPASVRVAFASGPYPYQAASCFISACGGGSTAVTGAFPMVSVAGDTIAVEILFNPTGSVSVSGVTDTAMNSYTVLTSSLTCPGISFNSGNSELVLAYATNIVTYPASENAITVHFSGTGSPSSDNEIFAEEFYGAPTGSTPDTCNQAHSTSGTPSVSYTTTANWEFTFSCAASSAHSSGDTINPPFLSLLPADPMGVLTCGYYVQPAPLTGTPSASYTYPSGNWGTNILSFTAPGLPGHSMVLNSTAGDASTNAVIDGTQFSNTAATACSGATPLSADDAGSIQAAICAAPNGSTIVYYTALGGGTLGSDPFEDPHTGSPTTKEIHLILGPGIWNVTNNTQIGIPKNSVFSGALPAQFGNDLNNTRLLWQGSTNLNYGNCGGGSSNCTYTMVCMGPSNNGTPGGGRGTQAFCYNGGGMGSFVQNQPSIKVYNMLIDCAGAQNVSGLVDNTSEELGQGWNLSIKSCSNDQGGHGFTNALRIGSPNDGNSAENSGPWGDMNIEYGDNCQASAIPLINYEDVTNFAGHITLNKIGQSGVGTPCGNMGTSVPLVGAEVLGNSVHVADIHIQSVTNFGLEVGGPARSTR